jgi:hypothetical protein
MHLHLSIISFYANGSAVFLFIYELTELLDMIDLYSIEEAFYKPACEVSWYCIQD